MVGTTTDALQYSLPGNYIIRWNYNDGNGNTTIQNQNVTITSEALPTVKSIQDFCLIDDPTISDIQITGTALKWYDAAWTSLTPSTVLVDETRYYATQTLDGGISSHDYAETFCNTTTYTTKSDNLK